MIGTRGQGLETLIDTDQALCANEVTCCTYHGWYAECKHTARYLTSIMMRAISPKFFATVRRGVLLGLEEDGDANGAGLGGNIRKSTWRSLVNECPELYGNKSFLYWT